MLAKTLFLVLVVVSIAQAASIERTKRQYGQYGQVAPAPVPQPVPVPALPIGPPAILPSPIAPVGMMGGDPLMSLILLSSLYGGNNNRGGGHHGHRYRKEAVESPQMEASELSADAAALMTDNNEEATQSREKRQFGLGLGGLGGASMLSPLGAVGGGSPIMDLLLLSSLYGNGGLFGGSGNSHHHHH
jgi:hypothetical protein